MRRVIAVGIVSLLAVSYTTANAAKPVDSERSAPLPRATPGLAEDHLPWAVCVTLQAPSGPMRPRPGGTFLDSFYAEAEDAAVRRHEIILNGVITSRTGDNGDEEDEWPADMIYKSTVEHVGEGSESVCVAGE